MAKKSREKAALAVAALLVALCLGVFWVYLHLGSTWNQAATSLDDKLGSMDGYTAILFQGVDQPDLPGTLDDSDSLLFEVPPGTGVEDVAAALRRGTSILATPRVDPVEVDDVRESYEGKGARTLVVDVTRPERYALGRVVTLNGTRLALCAALEGTSALSLQRTVDGLLAIDADLVVVVTPDVALLEGIEGVDVVICTGQEPDEDERPDVDALCVYAPSADQVGAVIVSPSTSLSSKTIKAL